MRAPLIATSARTPGDPEPSITVPPWMITSYSCARSEAARTNGRSSPANRYRNVSINRRQVRYEKDGSFKIVIAHRDPGIPNWLDAAGLTTGMIFWRFLLPEEHVGHIETELVDVDSLRSGD